MSIEALTTSLRKQAMIDGFDSPMTMICASPTQRRLLSSLNLTPQEAEALEHSWHFVARHGQLLPPGLDWDVIVWITGRGYGKTRCLSEFAHMEAKRHPGLCGALAARTLGDVDKVMIGHPKSGLMATQHADNPCEFKRHLGKVYWANGAYAELHSSEEPDKARGPENAWAACDEIGTWKRQVDFAGNTTFDNLQFGLRGGGAGSRPRMAVGSTPRAGSAAIRDLIERSADPAQGVRLVTGTLFDNAANLPDSYIERIVRRYKGTRLFRQEALGELLDDVADAIITQARLDHLRVSVAPDLRRVVIGVDVALGHSKRNDQTGINASGIGVDGHLYSLANRSCRLSPDGWGRRVVDCYHEFGASCVVAESNVMGEAIATVINAIDPSIRVLLPRATRSKAKRAEPILAYFERGEAHIVGEQDTLEDQLSRFTPSGWEGDGSPDDADAFVWAATELMPIHGQVDWAATSLANAG